MEDFKMKGLHLVDALVEKLETLENEISQMEHEQRENDDKDILKNVISGMTLQHKRLHFANVVIMIELINKITLLRENGSSKVPVYTYLSNQLRMLNTNKKLDPNVLLPIVKVIQNDLVEDLLNSIRNDVNALIIKLSPSYDVNLVTMDDNSINEHKIELEKEIDRIGLPQQERPSKKRPGTSTLRDLELKRQKIIQKLQQELQQQPQPFPETINDLSELSNLETIDDLSENPELVIDDLLDALGNDHQRLDHIDNFFSS